MKKILLILTALTVSAAAFAEKITTVAGITSGNKYYVGATTGDKDYYFYVDGSAKTESIKGVAKEDVADAVALTFTAVTDGWTIQFDNGNYLGLKNAADNGAVQVMEDPVVWAIAEVNNLLKLSPNGTYCLQKNNNSTQFGSFKSTQTKVWLESAGSAPVLATLDSLVIKGKAEKMEYELGEAFDPAGLEVWGIYTKIEKHDSTSQIKSGITWTLDPETFEEASNNASVTMVASFKELTTADTTITGIKVNAVVPAPVPTDEIVLATGNWEAMGWANQPKILESGVLDAAGATAGQTLRIYVTPAADNWSCQVVSGWWSAIGTDKYPFNIEDSPYDLAAHNGALEIVLDDNNLAGFDLEGIVINGDGLVITKVALKNKGGEQTAPVVGDQFVDTISGLKFEVTSLDPKAVKVIANSYTGTTYTIPATVSYNDVTFAITEIGENAFLNCYSLESVTFESNACQNGIASNAFSGVGNPDPALLTLNGIWAKENLPDDLGNWYGGKFELAEDPTTPKSSVDIVSTNLSYSDEGYAQYGIQELVLTNDKYGVLLDIFADTLVGEFTEDDVDFADSYIVDFNTGAEIRVVNTGDIVVTLDGKNLALTATLIGADTVQYNISATGYLGYIQGDAVEGYVGEFAVEEVAIQQVAISEVNYIHIAGTNAAGDQLALVVKGELADGAIAAGTYTEVMACPGFDAQGQLNPSYVGNNAGVWFIQSCTLTVAADGSMKFVGVNSYDASVEITIPASGPTVDKTGITINGRKYGFPVRLVKEVPTN